MCYKSNSDNKNVDFETLLDGSHSHVVDNDIRTTELVEYTERLPTSYCIKLHKVEQSMEFMAKRGYSRWIYVQAKKEEEKKRRRTGKKDRNKGRIRSDKATKSSK